MQTFQFVAILLHMLAAIVWIGGMVFLGIVLIPILRRRASPREYVALIRGTGRRFRTVGWLCLLLLLGTGFFNLSRWGINFSQLGSLDLWSSTWGRILATKLILVGLAICISCLHDFLVGPRASALLEQSPESEKALRLRRVASWMGRANLLIAIAIVALALMLVRGVPV